MFTQVYQRLPMFTHVYRHLPMFTHVYPCLLIFTYVYSSLPMFTHVYSRLPMFTHLLKFTHVYSSSTMFTLVYQRLAYLYIYPHFASHAPTITCSGYYGVWKCGHTFHTNGSILQALETSDLTLLQRRSPN